MNYNRIKLFTLLTLLGFSTYSQEGNSISSFQKVMVGPHVELTLISGAKNSVEIDPGDFPADKVNVQVQGNQLQIYLDNAKMLSPQVRVRSDNMKYKEDIYKGVTVRAYVTYTELNALQVRGEDDVRIEGTIDSERFKLRLYGESNVLINTLESERVKIKAFGDHEIVITSGDVEKLVFRSFGDNVLETEDVNNEIVKTSIFGEARISSNVSDKLKVSCLGEGKIKYTGRPVVNRGLILGETDIIKASY